jgi:hypothetical protein
MPHSLVLALCPSACRPIRPVVMRPKHLLCPNACRLCLKHPCEHNVLQSYAECRA